MAWSGRETRGVARCLLGAGLALAAIAAVAAWGGPPASADVSSAGSGPTRYSLANGCYALRSLKTGKHAVKSGGGYQVSAGPVGAEPFRMQATDLGSYLFYGKARDFLALNALGAVAPAAQPSDDSDWTVTRDGDAFRVSNGFAGKDLGVNGAGALVAVPAGSSGAAGRFDFTPVGGCPRYPEVEVNVVGEPTRRTPPYVEVSGMVEGHMHQMAFEFLGGQAHCGRPWHRFGAPSALTDCIDHYPTGCTAVLENVLYGDPARCHDPVGWPTFKDWPDPKSLTHEQSYYKWLERAHRAGLRIFVNLLVENRVLCELYPLKRHGCDEMDSVRREAKDMHQLQRYIDAQNGGPGKGWFRIVHTPFEARHVINKGKLAVIMGMEVSEPFGCGLQAGQPACTAEELDDGIDEIYKLGVRQVELINKFDNALAGVAGDNGTFGGVVNLGNFYATGSYWDLEHCDDLENHDHSPTALEHNDDMIIANGLEEFLPIVAVPAYPPPPHCNRLGLSDLGRRAIGDLMEKGMMFDPDHMGVYARNSAMDLIEARGYPGIISSHSWSTPNALRRISRLGGMITPYAGGSEGFVHEWQHVKAFEGGHGGQYFGIGYGADMNGFGAQGGPRGPGISNPVTYPFKSFDGSATVYKQHSGERVYDINTDGVAHYGLYPDWVQDLRMIAGKEIVNDMGRGAEAYLQTWERAVGVEGSACRAWPGRVRASGIGDRLRLGEFPKQVLFRAGQPDRRTRAWKWCARGRPGGPKRRVIGVFNKHRHLALVLSDLSQERAGGLHRGSPVSALRREARSLGGKLWVSELDGGRSFVYLVREGAVRWTGVASGYVAQDPAILRRHLRFAGLA